MSKSVVLLGIPFLLAITACSPEQQVSHNDMACIAPKDVASLTGTYSAPMIAITGHGKKEGSSLLELVVDSSGVVSGTYSWEATEGHGDDDAGQKVRKDSEEIIGVFDARDCEFGLAETKETGIFRGRLLPDRTLDLILVEPGTQPAVKLLRYKKLSS